MDPDVEKENFELQVRGTKNTENYFIPKYEPTPTIEHWNDLMKYYIPGGDYVHCGEDVNACEEDYLEWYREISHPFVINKEQQARTDKAKAKEKDKEAKRAQKEMPICGKEAVWLWDNVVKNGKKLLKKGITRIRSGESISAEEQTMLHGQWEELISQRMVEESWSKQLNRGRQQGEGSSRDARGGDGSGGGVVSPTDEEVQHNTRGKKGNKRVRRCGHL